MRSQGSSHGYIISTKWWTECSDQRKSTHHFQQRWTGEGRRSFYKVKKTKPKGLVMGQRQWELLSLIYRDQLRENPLQEAVHFPFFYKRIHCSCKRLVYWCPHVWVHCRIWPLQHLESLLRPMKRQQWLCHVRETRSRVYNSIPKWNGWCRFLLLFLLLMLFILRWVYTFESLRSLKFHFSMYENLGLNKTRRYFLC